MDNSALWALSYGLYAIGTKDSVKPTACIVNTVFQITSENPIIAVSMNKGSYTLQSLKQHQKFSVNILAEQVDPTVIGKLGFASGRDTDKLATIPYLMDAADVPVLKDQVCSYLICEVIATQDVETHCLVLARVIDAYKGSGQNPMTYEYYHKQLKGQAPKEAPTARVAEPVAAAPQTVKYICNVCGYVHEGPMDGEPDDYKCPICGVDKSHFELG